MLLSHTLQQPTQRLHVSAQLLALIKEAEEGVFLFFRGTALLFAIVTDANISLTLVKAICRFAQYLSVCVTVCDSLVCIQQTAPLTHTHTHTRWHLHCFYFHLSFYEM